MKKYALLTASFFLLAANIWGQTGCLSKEEAGKIIDSMKSLSKAPENNKLRKELIEMRREREKLDNKISVDTEKNQNLIPGSIQMGEKHLLRICQILKENGWLTRE